jgi:hypothetical protein
MEKFEKDRIKWANFKNDMHRFVIPRINFNHQSKLKKGLKTLYQDLAAELDKYMKLKINDEEWGEMIEYCFLQITEFVGKGIGRDLDNPEKPELNLNPINISKSKKSRDDIEKAEQQMNAREYALIRSEFDSQESQVNDIVNIIEELQKIIINSTPSHAVNKKFARLFELNEKLNRGEFPVNLIIPDLAA